MAIADITITPYAALPRCEKTDAALDRIFFEASASKTFASEAARTAFRDLWLTSYLAREPEHAYVACDAGAVPVGYVIGSHRDPARSERLAQLSYFADFAHMTRDFPAELHVNLADGARGQGIGALLIVRFIEDAAAANVAGVHVVTGDKSRNVSFYRRHGFIEKGRTLYKGADLVFLGRDLSS